MLKILLACNAGMSTSLLVNKMKVAAREKSIECDIVAMPVSEAKQHIEEYSCVMLGPQVGHEINNFKRLTRRLNMEVDVISSEDYGKVDGAAVLARAIEMCNK